MVRRTMDRRRQNGQGTQRPDSLHSERSLGVEPPLQLQGRPKNGNAFEIPLTRRRSVGKWMEEGEGAYLVPQDAFSGMKKSGFEAYQKALELDGKEWRLVRRKIGSPADIFRKAPEGSLWVVKNGKTLDVLPEPRSGSRIILLDETDIPDPGNTFPDGKTAYLQEEIMQAKETSYKTFGESVQVAIGGKAFRLFREKPGAYMEAKDTRENLNHTWAARPEDAGAFKYTRHGNILVLEYADFEVYMTGPKGHEAFHHEIYLGQTSMQIEKVEWKNGSYTAYKSEARRRRPGTTKFTRPADESGIASFLEKLVKAASKDIDVWRFLSTHPGLVEDIHSRGLIVPPKPELGFFRVGDAIWKDNEYLFIQMGQGSLGLAKATEQQKFDFLKGLSGKAEEGDSAAQAFILAHANIPRDMISLGICCGAGRRRF